MGKVLSKRSKKCLNHTGEKKTSPAESKLEIDPILDDFHDRDFYKLLKFVTNEAVNQASGKVFIQRTIALISTAINAEQYNVYKINELETNLQIDYSSKGVASDIILDINTGDDIVCEAARNKEIVTRETSMESNRSNAGMLRGRSKICIPFMKLDKTLLTVVDFEKSGLFLEKDVLVSAGIASLACSLFSMNEAETAVKSFNHQDFNDFLLEVSKELFENIISFDELVYKIMTFSKQVVAAERCSFFLVDEDKQEMVASLFDDGDVDEYGNSVFIKREEIRFPLTKGIAGLVATTGEVVNIHSAYQDERFNRDVDDKTGFVTRSILCMPIKRLSQVIGVVSMVNKKTGGYFTKATEEAFRSFSVYCSMALYNATLYNDLQIQKNRNEIALEQLTHHICVDDSDVKEFFSQALPRMPDSIKESSFFIMESGDETPGLVFNMANELFQGYWRFDQAKLARFILTVRKNYRPVLFHNWVHAFNVTHCMYWLLTKLHEHFTVREQLALFIGCLCHDLDHRGFTNNFMKRYDQPLAALYSTSVMEQHHYDMTVTILQQTEHDIFGSYNKESYKEILEGIRKAIIATDIALYVSNQAELKRLYTSGTFNIENSFHRDLFMANMMTASDLSAVCKPWDVQENTARKVYSEFFREGDEDKRKGLNPLPFMDRDNEKKIPHEQVKFIENIAMPAYTILSDIIPGKTYALVDVCLDNLKKWRILANETDETGNVVWHYN